MSIHPCAYPDCWYPGGEYRWCDRHLEQVQAGQALTPLGPVEPTPISVEELAAALGHDLPAAPGADPDLFTAPEEEPPADAADGESPRSAKPRRYYPSFAAAFHAQVRPTPTCWEWTADGATTPNGLPILRVDGQSVTARRYTYEFLHGPIPEGKRLRNRNGCAKTCVNPAHYGHKTD